MIKQILEMIEAVDPEDTGKLDEIVMVKSTNLDDGSAEIFIECAQLNNPCPDGIIEKLKKIKNN